MHRGTRSGRRRGQAAGLLVVAVLGAVAGCASAPTTGPPTTGRPTTEPASPTAAPLTPPTSPPSSASSSTTATAVDGSLGAVDRLRVRTTEAETDQPYVRDRFGDDWDYDPTTGCNTRELVLIEESLVPPQVDDRCRSTGGSWRSLYDGVVTGDPADLQIDHLVPLADAWRSGAAGWSDERRRAFANDREDPSTLIAVTGSTNQSKGDDTPDEWLPPERDAWCAYARAWVAVKDRWGLSVTGAEKAALVAVLSGC